MKGIGMTGNTRALNSREIAPMAPPLLRPNPTPPRTGVQPAGSPLVARLTGLEHFHYEVVHTSARFCKKSDTAREIRCLAFGRLDLISFRGPLARPTARYWKAIEHAGNRLRARPRASPPRDPGRTAIPRTGGASGLSRQAGLAPHPPPRNARRLDAPRRLSAPVLHLREEMAPLSGSKICG